MAPDRTYLPTSSQIKSMPAHRDHVQNLSIVDRMRACEPEVEGIILHQVETNSVSEYLLKQGSIAQQQNLLLGETLEEVRRQTTLTNGRVTACETLLAIHDKTLAEWKENTARWRKYLAWLLTIIGPIAYALINLVLKNWLHITP